jgi:CIC family chloride channel protein
MEYSYQYLENDCVESGEDSDRHRYKCEHKRMQGWVFYLFILHAGVPFPLRSEFAVLMTKFRWTASKVAPGLEHQALRCYKLLRNHRGGEVKKVEKESRAAGDGATDPAAPGKWLAAFSKAFGKSKFFRWFIYGTAIGTLSGLMAGLIFYLLEWASFFAMEYLAGYSTAEPAGEHIVTLAASTPFRPWLLVLLPTIGGLLSGLLVYTWAPEAEGHGTDAFIDAFHNKHGIVRTRVPFIKGIASVITLATGGSAGREGPIAQIGAGIGSWLGRALKLNVHERRLTLLAGCAAGLGAIFRAPLGGALTAVEVLYSEDLETEGVVLCIISSSVSYAIFTSIFGHQPIFAIPSIHFSSGRELLLYAILGLVCVPFGYMYVKTFYGLRDRFFRKLPIRRTLMPAFGGLLVGLTALWQPQILGGGYGVIQKALMGQLPIVLMFTLAFLKIAATSFTISSGGSGGVFGPSLFIGAMLGGAVGQLAHGWFPGVVSSPGAFALVGMAAFFAGVAKAPIGALLMVCEMTAGYELIVPIMFTSVVAILLSQRWSLYEKQLPNKFHSPAHRSDRVINILQDLPVKDVYNPEVSVTILPEDMTFAQLKRLITNSRESFFPVVDDLFHLVGILSLQEIRPVLFEESVADLLVLRDLVLPPVSVAPDDSLSDALLKFLETGFGQIPIQDREIGVIGMLSLEELLARYHQELQKLDDDRSGIQEPDMMRLTR